MTEYHHVLNRQSVTFILTQQSLVGNEYGKSGHLSFVCVWILATRDTQVGQELALVMQTTHAPRMRSADSIPMCRLEYIFFHWKCTQVLHKSLSI